MILSAISVFGLWYNATRSRFLAFVVFYGIYAGGYNALLPTTIAEIYGMQNYNTVNSSIYFLRGLGAIVGAPVAGVILGSHSRSAVTGTGTGIGAGLGLGALKGKYNDLVVYDGALLAGAGICVVYVRWLDAREKREWKWRA